MQNSAVRRQLRLDHPRKRLRDALDGQCKGISGRRVVFEVEAGLDQFDFHENESISGDDGVQGVRHGSNLLVEVL